MRIKLNPKSLLLYAIIVVCPSFFVNGHTTIISCVDNNNNGFNELIQRTDSNYYENFIIIGSYAYETNALKHLRTANQYSSDAGIFYHPGKRTFYVYAYKSIDKKKTALQLNKLKNHQYFSGAWILTYQVKYKSDNQHIARNNTVPVTFATTKNDAPDIKKSNNSRLTSEAKSAQVSLNSSSPYNQKNQATKLSLGTGQATKQENNSMALKYVSGADQSSVPGYSDYPKSVKYGQSSSVVKASTNRSPTEFPNNQEDNEKSPAVHEKSQSNAAAILTGQNKESTSENESQNLNKRELLNEEIADDEKIYYSTYGGVKINHLAFHRNSTAIKGSSEIDLSNLISLMEKYPGLDIIIHGHANGFFRGKFIKINPEDRDYFNSTSESELVSGDSYFLSAARAELIKKYLQNHGIMPGRMTIQAWGGEKTLFPVDSNKAHLNSRVEIEFLP